MHYHSPFTLVNSFFVVNRKEVPRFSFDGQLKDLVLTNEDKNNVTTAKQKYYQPLIRVVTGVNEKSGKSVKRSQYTKCNNYTYRWTSRKAHWSKCEARAHPEIWQAKDNVSKYILFIKRV